MACDLETTQADACSSGIGKLSSPIELLKVTAQLSCQIADTEATNAIVDSFVARSGISDQTQIDAVTALVQGARDNGWWDKCDLIYPFVGGTAGTHAQNLKSSSFTITWNGTVTHDANGITGNAVDGYGATGYIPSSSGQMAISSQHFSMYCRQFSSITTRYYIGAGVTPRQAIQHGDAADRLRYYASDSLVQVWSPITAGFSLGTRISSTSKQLFNGQNQFSVNQAPSTLNTNQIFILCLNNVGTPAAFTDANLAGATAGSGFTFANYQLMAADWQAFQTSLGRQV